jgi:hypothetical protein
LLASASSFFSACPSGATNVSRSSEAPNVCRRQEHSTNAGVGKHDVRRRLQVSSLSAALGRPHTSVSPLTPCSRFCSVALRPLDRSAQGHSQFHESLQSRPARGNQQEPRLSLQLRAWGSG